MSGRFFQANFAPSNSADTFPTTGTGYQQIVAAGEWWTNRDRTVVGDQPFVAKHITIRVSGPSSDPNTIVAYRRNVSGTLQQSMAPIRPGETFTLDGVRITEVSCRANGAVGGSPIYVTAWTDGGNG